MNEKKARGKSSKRKERRMFEEYKEKQKYAEEMSVIQ